MTSDSPLLPAATRIGAVHLTVSDLERSRSYYTERIGLRLHGTGDATVRLGDGGEDLLVLAERRDARPARGTTGLYHFALLVPTRVELARALRRLVATRTGLTGASDHGVSEALYLSDPDQNGIEIYRDRPREEWPTENGRPKMGTVLLDVRALLDEAPASDGARPERGVGTAMGHVHLHVADLRDAERFYVGVLGFETTQRYGPSALFVSAGGYHHHVGLNTWQGEGAPPPPVGATGLRHFELVLPDRPALAELAARLRTAAIPLGEREGDLILRDPSGNGIVATARGELG